MRITSTDEPHTLATPPASMEAYLSSYMPHAKSGMADRQDHVAADTRDAMGRARAAARTRGQHHYSTLPLQHSHTLSFHSEDHSIHQPPALPETVIGRIGVQNSGLLTGQQAVHGPRLGKGKPPRRTGYAGVTKESRAYAAEEAYRNERTDTRIPMAQPESLAADDAAVACGRLSATPKHRTRPAHHGALDAAECSEGSTAMCPTREGQASRESRATTTTTTGAATATAPERVCEESTERLRRLLATVRGLRRQTETMTSALLLLPRPPPAPLPHSSSHTLDETQAHDGMHGWATWAAARTGTGNGDWSGLFDDLFMSSPKALQSRSSSSSSSSTTASTSASHKPSRHDQADRHEEEDAMCGDTGRDVQAQGRCKPIAKQRAPPPPPTRTTRTDLRPADMNVRRRTSSSSARTSLPAAPPTSVILALHDKFHRAMRGRLLAARMMCQTEGAVDDLASTSTHTNTTEHHGRVGKAGAEAQERSGRHRHRRRRVATPHKTHARRADVRDDEDEDEDDDGEEAAADATARDDEHDAHRHIRTRRTRAQGANKHGNVHKSDVAQSAAGTHDTAHQSTRRATRDGVTARMPAATGMNNVDVITHHADTAQAPSPPDLATAADANTNQDKPQEQQHIQERAQQQQVQHPREQQTEIQKRTQAALVVPRRARRGRLRLQHHLQNMLRRRIERRRQQHSHPTRSSILPPAVMPTLHAPQALCLDDTPTVTETPNAAVADTSTQMQKSPLPHTSPQHTVNDEVPDRDERVADTACGSDFHTDEGEANLMQVHSTNEMNTDLGQLPLPLLTAPMTTPMNRVVVPRATRKGTRQTFWTKLCSCTC